MVPIKIKRIIVATSGPSPAWTIQGTGQIVMNELNRKALIAGAARRIGGRGQHLARLAGANALRPRIDLVCDRLSSRRVCLGLSVRRVVPPAADGRWR